MTPLDAIQIVSAGTALLCAAYLFWPGCEA